MRRLLTTVDKELRVLRRDWQGLAVLFVLPAVFILIMSLALQGTFHERFTEAITVPVADQDQTPASRLLLQELRADGTVIPQLSGHDAAWLQRAVGENELRFGLVIRSGYGQWLASGKQRGEGPLVRILAEPALPAVRRAALQGAVSRAVQTLRVERLIASSPGLGMPASATDRGLTALPVAMDVIGSRGAMAKPNAVQQNVPAWLVFAMFFVVIPISTVFIVERQQGSLQRLRLMNVPPGIVLGGKILPYYLVNMAQMVVMLLVGAWLVPWLGGDQLDLGGSLLGLWIIGSGTSLAAIGYALVISAVAETTVQATTFAGVTNLVMGAVGGVMVPKAVMAPSVQAFTVLSPMSWGLEGFWDILLRKQGWTAVLPEAGGLAGLGLICLLVAARAVRGKR